MTLLALCTAASALFAHAAVQAQQGPTTVQEIMVTLTIPASDAIFSAAYETPSTEEEWISLRRSAVTLGDSGKLLLTAAHEGEEEWTVAARGLIDQAQATVEAIDARDGEALMLASDEVYLACETCHKRFMER